jgi:hypothetical protein
VDGRPFGRPSFVIAFVIIAALFVALCAMR